MIRPEKILSCGMQGNILTMECAQGVMQIVPYADNILHFVYYPQNDSSCLTEETDGREKLPMWGIEAVPSKDSHSALTEEEDKILYSLSGAGLEVSRNDAEIKVCQEKCIGCGLCTFVCPAKKLELDW